jgi:mono/diheme cytochrome c family protein
MIRSSLAAVLLLAACHTSDGKTGDTSGTTDTEDSAPVDTDTGHPGEPTATTGTPERGQYLVDHVLQCGACHTPTASDGSPDMSLYLAGSRSYDFTDVDGTIVTVNAENLTNHNPEGLYNWSDEQVRTALVTGIDDEHVAIYPIMPFPEYSLLTVADQDSIIQYLRTVPANPNVVASDYPYGDQQPPVQLADDSTIPHTTLAADDPDYEAAERGRYLAKTGCLYCHTEELSSGVPDMSKAFGGGKVYTFIRDTPPNTSTNITPDPTGLGSATVDEIVTALKTNTAVGTGAPLCSTHPGGFDRIDGMTDDDLRDIAVYLHSLAPVSNGPFTCVAP